MFTNFHLVEKLGNVPSGGSYISFDSNGEIGSLKVGRDSPFPDRA